MDQDNADWTEEMRMTFSFALLLAPMAACLGSELLVEPAVIAVQRAGITGAGFAVTSADGRRVTLHYPNHPDDFGGSAGTGTAVSEDGGLTWNAGADDWPIVRSVDLWQERLGDGSYVALGIRWLPDSQRRRELTAADMPADPWRIAWSRDGREWMTAEAAVTLTDPSLTIARPLPHIIELSNKLWLMPAYAWSKTGHRTMLLGSDDRGRRWRVHSTIATASAMSQAGVPVTTPWLETMVTRAKNGSLLAVMRTGSSAESVLLSARSADDGVTWSLPQKIIAGPTGEAVTGKLPNVLLLPNGMLALLTAHTKRGCHLYLSHDGTGREWNTDHVITTVTGGNTSMVAIDERHLLVFTPANGRINCWRVTLPH